MIRTRNDDDEPDVIDLTTSYGYYGSFNYPIRPPSPFADSPIRSQILSQHNEDNESNGVVIWSVPTKQLKLNCKTNNNENTALSSSHSSSLSSSSSHGNSTWRRRLNKLLKRTKLNKHKKVVSSTTSDIIHPYDFGIGEITRTDSIISRSNNNNNNNKRVHWIDDDEMILNASHHFIGYLKLFIENIIDEKNENDYLKNCQISLDELESFIDCHQIKQAFEDIIQLANKQDKNQLYEQQIYIENLISRSVLLFSA